MKVRIFGPLLAVGIVLYFVGQACLSSSSGGYPAEVPVLPVATSDIPAQNQQQGTTAPLPDVGLDIRTINTHVIDIDFSVPFDFDQAAYYVTAGDPVTITATPMDGATTCTLYMPDNEVTGPAPLTFTLQTKREWSGWLSLITAVCDWGTGMEMEHAQTVLLQIK